MVRIRESLYGVDPGMRCGERTVIGPAFSSGDGHHWRVVVKCDCGRIGTVEVTTLLNGHATRCGSCANRKTSHKHGGHNERLYHKWEGMRDRCNNPNCAKYADYGGRGIKVCEEWNDYASFRDWALANGYEVGLEIDRHPNNDGNYEPGNCRFVTRKKNMNNTRANRHLVAFGETKTVSEWLQDSRCVVKEGTLRARIRWGWKSEEAISTPPDTRYLRLTV